MAKQLLDVEAVRGAVPPGTRGMRSPALRK